MTGRGLSWIGAISLLTAAPACGQSLCNMIVGNLVQNCGFETGSFMEWTQGGNLGFEEITNSPFFVNSGMHAAFLGPIGSNGTLTQTITDAPGTVSLDFWLANFGSPADDFSVKWDGVTIPTASTPVTNAQPFPFTEQGPITLTSTGSDTLEFIFRQDPSFWGLDDISVVQVATPEPAAILLLVPVLGLCGWMLRKRPAGGVA